MENESAEGETLSLDLPAALDEWITERADELGVDRSELVVQLIGSYQIAADIDDESATEALADIIDEEALDIESTVREEVETAVAASTPNEDAVAGRVENRLETRLDAFEAEFQEKLDDVRRRVVQIKKATDSKASDDHAHEEFQRLDELESAIEELQVAVSESDETDDELAAKVDDLRSKLTQLARIVVQLRDDDDEETTEDEVLTEIQRTAAREGYEKAVCGACNETVSVGLLPEAECPHCRSPFGGLVEGAGGLFASKPRLVGPHGHRDTGSDDGSDEETDAANPMSDIVSDEETDGGEEGESPMSADGGEV